MASGLAAAPLRIVGFLAVAVPRNLLARVLAQSFAVNFRKLIFDPPEVAAFSGQVRPRRALCALESRSCAHVPGDRQLYPMS